MIWKTSFLCVFSSSSTAWYNKHEKISKIYCFPFQNYRMRAMIIRCSTRFLSHNQSIPHSIEFYLIGFILNNNVSILFLAYGNIAAGVHVMRATAYFSSFIGWMRISCIFIVIFYRNNLRKKKLSVINESFRLLLLYPTHTHRYTVVTKIIIANCRWSAVQIADNHWKVCDTDAAASYQ